MSTLLDTKTTTLTIRQSHLRTLEEGCPAHAYAVSVDGMEGPSGPGAQRGTAIHYYFARYVQMLAAGGGNRAQVIVDTNRAFPGLSLEQRQDLAAQAATIQEVFQFNRDAYYGVERPFATTIKLEGGGEATITGRLDYLEVEGDVARIVDVKSNHQIIPDSKVLDDFQLRIYAMLIFDNLPQVELVEGQLLLSRYGIHLPQKGKAAWVRSDMDVLRDHLSYRLAAHFAGDLKDEHVPGTWCGYCPLRKVNECTLYRSYYGTTPPPPLTAIQARKLARQIVALEDARETRIALIKQYVNEHGPLSVGSGDAAEVFDFHVSESEEIPATALMQILEDNHSLVGDQSLDELLSVKKTTKAYKSLRWNADLRSAFEDVAQTKRKTIFGHKAVSDGD